MLAECGCLGRKRIKAIRCEYLLVDGQSLHTLNYMFGAMHLLSGYALVVTLETLALLNLLALAGCLFSLLALLALLEESRLQFLDDRVSLRLNSC